MTDYTITTDFGAKDSLPSGNAAKVIKGSEFTTEFTNILTAVNSKADSAGDTFTGAVIFDAAVTLNADVTFDTNTMFVDVSANRVGIGNVAPATALDVTGVITTDGLTSSAGIDITGTVTASGLTVDTNTLHVDATNDRVGIGTTSPAHPLHAYHATTNIVGLLESGDTTCGIDLKDSAATGRITNTSGKLSIQADTGAEGADSRIDFKVDDSEKMRITSSGNVGIGTASPNRPLTVESSSVGLAEFESTDSTSKVYFKDSGTTNTYSVALGSVGDEMAFYASSGGAEAMRIDSSGNVGIGTTSPVRALDVRGGTTDVVANFESSDTGGYISLQDNTTSSDTAVLVGAIGDALRIDTGDTESVRIDSSGNLLVGTTNANLYNDTAGSGIALHANGRLDLLRDSAANAIFNRLGTDGEQVIFNKDGTTVGSIGTIDSDLLIYSSASGHKGLRFGNGYVAPTNNSGTIQDNTTDLGLNSYRFQDIYATNGTIQTSDRNEKQGIRELLDAEQRVATACKGLLRAFKWNSAVEEKGDEARIHFGIIAQDLQDAFTAEGLDAGDYAMFINSTWTDEETGEERSRMGVRYSELLAFIISAI